MFVVYFHAATAKLAMEEWLNGTVLYYWLNDPVVGLSNWLRFLAPSAVNFIYCCFDLGDFGNRNIVIHGPFCT